MILSRHNAVASRFADGGIATIVQVPISTVKEAFPIREVEQVVDAMIDTNDSVELHLELKAAHISDVEGRSLGKFLTGTGQHARRYVQAAHLISGRKRSNNAASSAGNLEQRHRPTAWGASFRSEEHTSALQSLRHRV